MYISSVEIITVLLLGGTFLISLVAGIPAKSCVRFDKKKIITLPR